MLWAQDGGTYSTCLVCDLCEIACLRRFLSARKIDPFISMHTSSPAICCCTQMYTACTSLHVCVTYGARYANLRHSYTLMTPCLLLSTCERADVYPHACRDMHPWESPYPCAWCFVHLGCCSMHAGPASDASLPGAEDMVSGKLIAVRRADLQRSLMSLQVIACELGPRNTCCTNLTCWRWENKMGATEQSSAALDCSFDPLTGATKYKSLEAHIEMESGSKELPEAMIQTSTNTHACSFLLKLLTFQLRPMPPVVDSN